MNALPQLDFMQAVQLSLNRIKEMDGRSRRSEFWWTMLAVGICSVIASVIPYVGYIIQLGLWVVAIPLMARRLHDTGRGHGLAFAYVGLYALYLILAFIIYLKAKSVSSSDSLDDLLDAYNSSNSLATIAAIAIIVAGIIGIILIVFCCQDSQPFTNKYGPSPKYPDGPQNQQMYGQPPYGQQQYGPQQPPYNQQQYGPQQPPYNQQQYGPQQPPYNQQQYGPQQPPYNQPPQ